MQKSRELNNFTHTSTLNAPLGGVENVGKLNVGDAKQGFEERTNQHVGPLDQSYNKRSETSRNRNEGRLLGSQSSHSKILANLSRNFQEFKEDVRQLKESIGQHDDSSNEKKSGIPTGTNHYNKLSTTRSNDRDYANKSSG